MITEIRRELKSSGFRIILWMMLLSMVIVFIPNIFKRGGEGQRAAIATVDGYDIELMDFQRRLYQETERISMFKHQFGPQADEILKALGFSDPKTMAINSLVQETLLNQASDKIKLTVSPDFINQKLNDPNYIAQQLSDVVPYYLIDQQGVNVGMLKRYLAQQRITMNDFEKRIEDKIKRSVLLEIAELTAYASSHEAQEHYKHSMLGKEYSIATFPFKTYLQQAKKTPLTPQEVSAYYDQAHKKYWLPETRSGTVWKFSPEHYGIALTDAEIDSFYKNHKSRYLESPLQMQMRRILVRVDKTNEQSIKEAQQKIEKIKKDLDKNPHDFERLAREYSEDKSSSAQGGLLDFFKKGDKDPEVEHMVFRLQNDGDITEIIPTDEGFEVLQRVARKPAAYKPLASVTQDIKKDLLEQKFKTQFTDDVTKILNRQDKEQRATLLQEFARSKKAHQESITNMKNDGSPLAEKLFKVRQGDWTWIYYDGKGTLVTVSSIEKSYKPDLGTVKNKVEEDLYSQKARELLKKELDALKPEDLTNLKKNYPFISLSSTGLLKKDDAQELEKLQEQGIPVNMLESLKAVNDHITSIDENNGYYMQVIKAEEFNPEEFKSHEDGILDQQYQEQKQLMVRGFIASLYRNAKINLTQSLNIKDEDTL